jgi:hypothetical protein
LSKCSSFPDSSILALSAHHNGAPHFTLQNSPQGPLLTAYIGVSEARRNALTAAGQAVPALQQIRALVDTGASGTCVDPSVLQALSLTPTGSTVVNTPTTGQQPHTVDTYDVSFYVPGATTTHLPFVLNTLEVMCAELLAPQGFHALIGRDILADCVLIYNGPVGTFTLAY